MFALRFLLLLPLALAAPAPPTSLAALQSSDFSTLAKSVPKTCPLGNTQIPLPAGLTLPAGQKLSLVTVGRGTQNYTCTKGAYVSAGAVADLYDASCIFTATSRFALTASVSKLLPQIALKGIKYPATIGLPVAVKHFFTTTPGAASGISPVFASSADKVILKKDVGIDAVNPTENVQYLKLVSLEGQGTLSKTVFRLDTASGQPPSSCATEGEVKTVQYAAMYYFAK